MNIADRSLALVDLALRRRFAFINLEPALNGAWRAWCIDKCGFDPAFVSMVEERINSVNVDIASDRSLRQPIPRGPQLRDAARGRDYYRPQCVVQNIVQTELFPLLEEYWFDAPEKAKEAATRLLVDIPE